MTDARMASLLVNDARRRAVVRFFGVPPEQANLVTAVALLVIADAAHDRVRGMVTGSRGPTLGESALAGASIRSVLGALTGPVINEIPGLGALITLALVGHAIRPAAARSLHAMRTGSHRLSIDFHHRYGYLIDPHQRRLMRARQQYEAARSRRRSAAGPRAQQPITSLG